LSVKGNGKSALGNKTTGSLALEFGQRYDWPSMIKKFVCWLVTMVVLDAVTLFAQEGTTKPAEGKLTLSKKTYQLAHAVAYESATGGEPDLTVVLTASPVSNEKLKKALATEKEGGFGEFPQPFLKLIFTKTGELKNFSASGGGTTIGGSSDGTGELKLQDGRVVGKASAALDPSAVVPKGFDVRFDVALHRAGDQLPVSTAKKYGPPANVKPSVTGIFKGNGKDANLAFVSARWVEPFSGKTGITLVFTEKDHSKVKKPDIDAMFGKFGSALIISLHEDGDIYGCQVVHSAHKKQGFSSIGSMETSGFSYDAGKVEGDLTTNGEANTFGDTWEVKLKFVAPLGEIPKEFQVADSTTEETKQTSTRSTTPEADDASEEKPATRSAVPGLKAKDLALTSDATDVEYKALVEQMSFKSKLPVKSACAELTKNLQAQGWTNEGSDLITANSSILRRKRGEASLTIFVKPENGGSEIKITSEGLSWEGQ
jgi:hypothetical protein